MFPGRGLYVYYNLEAPANDKYEEREGLMRWIEIDGDKCRTNRTVSLDYTVGELKKRDVRIPVDYENYPDYKNHFKNIIRVIREDSKGNKKGVYEEIGPDHIAHAANYAKIALEVYLDDGGLEFL